MQREEMTSQLDLHFTPLFERLVGVLCQFLHLLRPTGPEASVDQKQSVWLTTAAFKSGAGQIHM